MFRKMTLAAAAVLAVGVSVAQAAPIVTMQTSSLGGNTSLDFYYSASAGAEFTNYNLKVDTANGAKILDLIRTSAGWWDEGGDAVDTWANTPFSLLYGVAPSSVFQAYKPNAPSQSPTPTASMQWEIFSTDPGQGNTIDTFTAPWHIARVLVAPDAIGTVVFTAYDTQSGGVPTPFTFAIGQGPIIPEPATISLIGLAMVGFLGFRRRQA
jgi:hypothetical protein